MTLLLSLLAVLLVLGGIASFLFSTRNLSTLVGVGLVLLGFWLICFIYSSHLF